LKKKLKYLLKISNKLTVDDEKNLDETFNDKEKKIYKSN